VLVLKISFIFGGRGGEVTLGLLKVTWMTCQRPG
jgi:hypothetical protein